MKERMVIVLVILGAVLIAGGFSISLQAGDTGLIGFNLHTFRPSTDGSGVLNSIGSRSLDPGQVHESLYLNYNQRLLRRQQAGPSLLANPIEHQLMGDWNTAVGLPLGLTTGVNIPIVFWQNGKNGSNVRYDESDVGDISWFFKSSLLKEDHFPFGAALFGNISFPNGKRRLFTGSSNLTKDIFLSIDKSWENIYAVINFGHSFATADRFQNATDPAQTHDDEFIVRGGVRLPFSLADKKWGILLDTQGRWLREKNKRESAPVEMMIGFDGQITKELTLVFSTATALNKKAIGVPDKRYILALKWHSPGRISQTSRAGSDSSTVSDVLDVLYFDFDSAAIHNEEEGGLQDVLRWLEQNPSQKILIEGHTNGEGTESYNEDLSKRRAQAAATWLENKGADSSRFQAVWFGQKRPAGDNTREEGRAKNRRVEIRKQ